MATIGNGSFQPLEGLSSSAKKYTKATADANSQTFEPLTGSAMQYQHNAGGDFELPMLTMTFTMLEGRLAVGDLTLPPLESVAYGGWNGDQTLPGLVLAATGTVPGMGVGVFELPLLEMDGSGTSGMLGQGRLTLPMLEMAGAFGWQGAMTLPALLVAGSGTTLEASTGNLVLPLLEMTGNVSVFSLPSYGELILPALISGPYTIGQLELPMIIVTGSVTEGGVLGAFEGWAMNTRNGAVTRITNWPFTRIIKWGDKLLGVASDGLYLIGGTKDRNVVIPWEWRSGLEDFGQPGLKRIPMLYTDGIIDGEVFITTTDDKLNLRRYRYEADRGRIHMTHRRELGKGVLTRNMAFGMSNGPNGAFVEIDGLEPEATHTQRNT